MAGVLVAPHEAVPAAAQRDFPLTDRRTRLAAVAILVVLNVLDVVTTRHVIVGLGGVEGNPLSRWLIAHGILGATKAAIAVFIGLMVVRLPARRASSLALWLAVGVYFAVVLHNVVQIATV